MGEPERERAPTREQRVKALVEEVVAGSPVYVVDVVVRGGKGSRVVDVFVESDETLDVEELARINREVGFLLDVEDIIDGHYRLNVSSPGVDRPLMLPRQFRKNIGRQLRVRYRAGGGSSTVEGELTEADAGHIVIVHSGEEAARVAYDDVEEARVLLPW